MDECDNCSIWFVCKICNLAFQNRLDFLKHKAHEHRKMEAALGRSEVDPFLKPAKDLISEIKVGNDYEFDTIDTSSLFKLEPVHVNDWESTFGEEVRDIMVTLKTLDDFPSKKQNKKRPNTTTNPVPCDKCDKTFSSKYTLNTHMKIHDGVKPFECEQCGKHFTQKINLQYHMRIHTGEKPHICNHCKKSFAQVANLSTHVRRCHAAPNQTKLKTPKTKPSKNKEK